MTSMAPVILGAMEVAKLSICLESQRVIAAHCSLRRDDEFTHTQLHGKLLEVDRMIVAFDLIGQSCCFLEQVRMPRVQKLLVGIGLNKVQSCQPPSGICYWDSSYLI